MGVNPVVKTLAAPLLRIIVRTNDQASNKIPVIKEGGILYSSSMVGEQLLGPTHRRWATRSPALLFVVCIVLLRPFPGRALPRHSSALLYVV